MIWIREDALPGVLLPERHQPVRLHVATGSLPGTGHPPGASARLLAVPMNSPRPESYRMELEPECPSPRQFVSALRPGAPPLSILSDGEFHRQPQWFHGFVYDNQTSEDLACPGEFRWELQPRQRAHLIASTAEEMSENPRTANEVAHLADKLRNAERTRRTLFRSELDRAADQVQSSPGPMAAPWFPVTRAERRWGPGP